MPFQLAAARISFAALLVAAILALGAVAGVRLELFAYAFGYRLMIAAVALGVIAFLAGATFCYSAFQHNRGEGRRLGLIGFFGSMLLLYPPLDLELRGLSAPAIHDASSDPDDPPPFVMLAKARQPGQNGLAFDGQSRIHFRGQDMTIAYALHEYYLDVTKPHAGLLTPPPKAFWRSVAIAKNLGWTIIDTDQKAGRIEATDTSLWFGRVSDIVIRVRPAGPIPGSRVDVRSASRDGAFDRGENLARLKAFFGHLKL